MKAIEIIRNVRKEKKISQEYMAEKLQIARSSYQAIESGTNNMNINDFFKIIEILEIPLSYFTETESIVIDKDDLEKLDIYSNEIKKIIDKVKNDSKYRINNDSNIAVVVGNNNKINQTKK